jgi:hypothetical protein
VCIKSLANVLLKTIISIAAFSFILKPLLRELTEEDIKNVVTVVHAGCHSTCSKLNYCSGRDV